MQITTFGSCYARYVANHFAMLTNSRLVSCTYHNRSDFFVDKYFNNKYTDDFYDQLIQLLSDSSDESRKIDPDSSVVNIIKNQTSHSSGAHRLSSGKNFFQCIENTDLIIIDNYMDVSAKLFANNDNVVFFNSRDPLVKSYLIEPGHVSLDHVTELLTANASFKNFNLIVNYVKRKNPNAFVVFLNFPFNTYFENPTRVKITKEFEKLSVGLGSDLVLPSLMVPKQLQTHQKQHFKAAFYSYVAGRILENINFKMALKNKIL
ncbi:hypothetical protein B0H98_101316 [Vreelandella songnenensis]|uniref:GSCFA family protein n=1 Tax=Vreelandella songnenensis TaxID=1176243 RepID=A0A2T0V818_9GAMM|nr:hypothetical protein [Halomonas songnenensis]PRY66335.1 hypothetical protein B0H98_101316 [Halomonas songnenensis]